MSESLASRTFIPMDYVALITDGDGTSVRDSHMARETEDAFNRWRATGRKLILVTGETERQLADFPHLGLFDRVVAENGAVLLARDHIPERQLANPPPAALIRALENSGCTPLRRGRVILQADLAHADSIQSVLK